MRIDPLADEIEQYACDPVGFVRDAFRWQQDALKHHSGPRAWQSDILAMIGEHLSSETTRCKPLRIAVASGHGIGKALRPSARVPTPYGYVDVADVVPGFVLFGEDGAPVKVLATQNYDACPFYRVSFSDGTSVEVSSGHLWKVRNRQDRRNGLGWRVVETLGILRAGVRRSNGDAKAKQWEVPRAAAVEYAHSKLPVDPYTYGVWLGDGDKRSGRVTNMDPEVWACVAYKTTKSDGLTRTLLGLKSDLIRAGLFGCTTYTASVDYRYMVDGARLAVLQGLMDTDGWVERSCGSAAFASASRQLTRDVIELARSLGLRAREEKFKKNLCAGSWSTHITWDGVTQLFKIARKQGALVAAEARYKANWIESIEPVESGPGICFEVEGGVYLTDQFIVTHNSALVGMIVDWAMSTCAETRVVVTANTESQLRTKTWPEIAKWVRLAENADWFAVPAMSMYEKAHEKSWRADASPWSENNTESFAGLHNEGKRIVLIMDEASGISDKVWEVAEGAMTDSNTEILWLAFGNPTRNTGRFRECFGSQKHLWKTRQIDSRLVEGTNREYLDEMVNTYGEDSDFVRIRVRGVFPRAGTTQFIGSDVVELAATRDDAGASIYDALVLGVDVARFGDDESVIFIRKGRDGRTHPPLKFRGLDTMQLAARVAEQAAFYRADAVFVDGGGVGGGVVDRLRQLRVPNVFDIQFGGSSDRSMPGAEQTVYANKRAEMWGWTREWLKGGTIPDDQDMRQQLEGCEYGYVLLHGREAVALEKKSDMKKRGLSSPDIADALALTFAYPVQANQNAGRAAAGVTPRIQSDYDPYDEKPHVQTEYNPYA